MFPDCACRILLRRSPAKRLLLIEFCTRKYHRDPRFARSRHYHIEKINIAVIARSEHTMRRTTDWRIG